MAETLRTISDVINGINKSQEIQFKLENPEEYCLLPYCQRSHNVIYYGNNTNVYLIFYNWGTKELQRKFFLQNEFAICGFYKEALSILTNVISEYSKLKRKIINGFSKEQYKLTYQSLFMVFHEMGHCVLYSHKDIRESYYNGIKKEFNDTYGTDDINDIIKHHYKSNAPWYLRSLSRVLGIDLKGQVEKMLSKHNYVLDKYIEEFACDYYSADMFFKLNNRDNCFSAKEMQLICSSIIDTQSCVAESEYLSKYLSYEEKIPNSIIPLIAFRRSLLFARLHELLEDEYDQYLKVYEKDCINNNARFQDYFMLSRFLKPYADFLEQGPSFDYDTNEKESYDAQVSSFIQSVISDLK